MARPKRDNDRAAAIIVDAELLGAPEAARKWQVSVMTISRYRAALETDDELLRLVTDKKVRLNVIPPEPAQPVVADVLADVLAFLGRAAREGNHKDPDVIHAVMGGYKVVREVQLAEKSLDAWLAALAAQRAGVGGLNPPGDRESGRSLPARA